jgi:hypothetical protein
MGIVKKIVLYIIVLLKVCYIDDHISCLIKASKSDDIDLVGVVSGSLITLREIFTLLLWWLYVENSLQPC